MSFSLPSMTFGQMKAMVRLVAWPDGEAENVLGLHDKMFVDAMIDIQQRVECQQVNNTQVYDFCSTFFQCGMTVITAPPGRIKSISVFDKLTDIGREDAGAAVNWCSQAKYYQVAYPDLTRVVDKKINLGGSCCGFPLFPANAGCCGGGIGNALTFYYGKHVGQRYNPPDDAGYTCFPGLPQGFHYPQSSTDSGKCRASWGVFALQRGRVYVAPFIQSTETIVIEWDGIKKNWTDNDLVEDNAMLRDCVYFYMKRGHARDVDGDDTAYIKYNNEYQGNPQMVGAVEKLWLECREETRVRDQEPSHSRMSFMTLEQQAMGQIGDCTTTTTAAPVTTTTTTTTCVQPTAPTSFTVTVPLDTQYATLAWVAGTGTLQQEIWRSLDCGDTYTSFAQVAASATGYVDTTTGDMPAGTCVCYKVRGTSQCGVSDFAAFSDNSNCGHIE